VALRLLHIAIAALGAYQLARAWRLPRASAAVAGVTFALGSFLQAHIHHENIVRTAAWLPLVLACLERALRAREPRRWIVAAATGLGMAGLGLHPQILVAELFALVLYGLLRSCAGPGARLNRLIKAQLIVVTTGTLGLALAAVQLIPLSELASLSARAGSFPYTEVAGQSLTPFGLPQLVLPFLFRDQQLRPWGLWTHWESYLYVGLTPLMLAVVSLVRVRHREVAVWAILGAAGLLLALGQYVPLDTFGLMRSIPGWRWLRAPGRFEVMADLASAMLAAHGLVILQARARRIFICGLVAPISRGHAAAARMRDHGTRGHPWRAVRCPGHCEATDRLQLPFAAARQSVDDSLRRVRGSSVGDRSVEPENGWRGSGSAADSRSSHPLARQSVALRPPLARLAVGVVGHYRRRLAGF